MQMKLNRNTTETGLRRQILFKGKIRVGTYTRISYLKKHNNPFFCRYSRIQEVLELFCFVVREVLELFCFVVREKQCSMVDNPG